MLRWRRLLATGLRLFVLLRGTLGRNNFNFVNYNCHIKLLYPQIAQITQTLNR